MSDVDKLNNLLKQVKITSDKNTNSDEKEISQDELRKTEKEINDLKLIIKSLDIIFNWKPYQTGLPETQNVKRMREKMDETVEESDFKFRNFILKLSLNYEEYITSKKLKETASSLLEKINECQTELKYLKRGNCKEPLFIAVYEPLYFHIVLGSKAYVMVEHGLFSEAKKIVKEILFKRKMTQKQLAALYGIKAATIIEYGPDYFRSALDYAVEAKKLDPSIAEWHFLTGQIMARIRHVEFTSHPINDELIAFEKAVQLCNSNIRYKIHLAQSYQDNASYLFHKQRKTQEANFYNQKCYKIYSQVLSEDTKDVHSLARCAFRITKLPRHLKDIPLAVRGIEKALRLSPDSRMAIHYAGIIYHRHLQDYKKAKEFYRKAADLAVYGAAVDLVKLKIEESERRLTMYDPLDDLKKLLKDFQEKDHYFQTAANIAAYYFFERNDIVEAWNYIREIIEAEPNHPCIRNLFAVVVRTKNTFDLCEVLVDEINNFIGNKKYKNMTEKETLIEIRTALSKAMTLSTASSRCSNMKKKILDESKELREGWRNNNHSHLKR